MYVLHSLHFYKSISMKLTFYKKGCYIQGVYNGYINQQVEQLQAFKCLHTSRLSKETTRICSLLKIEAIKSPVLGM